MLKGRSITLRPVLESDLDLFYENYLDIENRGDYYPQGIMSQAVVKKRFAETGFWEKDEGSLLICDERVSFTGGVHLRVGAGPGTTDHVVDGDLEANVPFLGRRIEEAVAPRISEIVRVEEQVAQEWLAAH